MNAVTKVVVSGLRGERGQASGPLGAGSVGPDEISGNPTVISAILAKLGVEDAFFEKGPSAAVIATTAKIDWKRETVSPSYPVASMAGLWTDKVTWSHAISAEFDAINAPVNTPFAAPAMTLLLAAHNKGTDTTMGAIQGIAGVHVNGKEAAVANFIAYSGAGVLNARLKALELDIQPGPGGTVSEAFGLGIVAFSMEIPGDAIHIASNSGGFMSSGMRIDRLNASTGSGIYAAGQMGSLVNSGAGVFGMDAILLSNTHAVRFWSTTGDKHGRMFADAGNFLNIVPNPAGLVIKNPETLATELLIEPSDGSVNLQGGGTIKFASSLSSSSASAGGATALPSAPAGYVTMSVGGTNRKFPFYA